MSFINIRMIAIIALIIATFTLIFVIFTNKGAVWHHSVNRKEIIATRNSMMDLQYALTDNLLQFESAVDKYIALPNNNTRNNLIVTKDKLNQNLLKASDLFGLNVKRIVDLLYVWEHYTLNTILNNPQNFKTISWNTGFSNYALLMKKEIEQSQQDYELTLVDQLLYGNLGIKKPLYNIKENIETTYSEKSKNLLPQQIQILKNGYNEARLSFCLPMREEESKAEYIANHVAILQYQSRYCPFLVKSKTADFCNALKRIPFFNKTEKTLSEDFVLCQIANDNLQLEAQESEFKYGSFSYDDYFNKFVEPLVENFINKIKTNPNQKDFMCNLRHQSVVNFRNPEVDAQLAAYVVNADKFCGGLKS